MELGLGPAALLTMRPKRIGLTLSLLVLSADLKPQGMKLSGCKRKQERGSISLAEGIMISEVDKRANRKYYIKHRDELLTQKQQYRIDNLESISEYQRGWRERNKQEQNKKARDRCRRVSAYLASFKVAVGCIDCGYKANPIALQFDHVRGVKLDDVSHMRLEAVEEEMKKCVVRCANCHAIRHHNDRSGLYDSRR
jgi:hypothetical protein